MEKSGFWARKLPLKNEIYIVNSANQGVFPTRLQTLTHVCVQDPNCLSSPESSVMPAPIPVQQKHFLDVLRPESLKALGNGFSHWSSAQFSADPTSPSWYYLTLLTVHTACRSCYPRSCCHFWNLACPLWSLDRGGRDHRPLSVFILAPSDFRWLSKRRESQGWRLEALFLLRYKRNAPVMCILSEGRRKRRRSTKDKRGQNRTEGESCFSSVAAVQINGVQRSCS